VDQDEDADHEHDEEEVPDMSEWLATANTATCPSCGAPGALMLGGGIFCPSCGEVSPGYSPPPA
jgi:hypothetical protein